MGYKDPEKAAAYAREWRAKHAEQVREDDRKRRAKEREEDPSAATQRMRDWRIANPEKAQAQGKIGTARHNERLKTDLVFKEKKRQRLTGYMAVPEVRERRRKQWREWAVENNSPELNRKHALKAYDLTFEQYDAMVVAQEGKCAICRTDKPGGKGKNWRIDHCHDRKQVRELLCHSCNTGLGLFKDKIELLLAAVAYLKKHQ